MSVSSKDVSKLNVYCCLGIDKIIPYGISTTFKMDDFDHFEHSCHYNTYGASLVGMVLFTSLEMI